MSIYLKKNLILVLAIAIAFTACKNETTEPVTNKKGIQLATNAKFGKVLTDKDGKTLYMFANDVAGNVTCTGGCETVWPLYYADNTSSDVELDKSLVGEITRTDGKKQSTYKGYPLYYYAKDMAVKEINGDGVGGVWFVAKPDYSIMIANEQLVAATINYTNTYAVGNGKTVYLTDSKGRTLYAFKPDKNGVNTFTKGPTQEGIWPVYESEILNLPSVITKADIGVITVASINKKQLTFKGWPLYYYAKDLKRGNTEGIIAGPTPGSVWPVLQLNTTPASN